jgi:cytochrome o ubiquinol oxidase subunit IV
VSERKQVVVNHFEPRGSVRSYVIGFVSCIALTLVAYFATTTDSISRSYAIGIVAVLAIIQCIVQLRAFLHLGEELKPRWKLGVFTLMIAIVLILVVGSLWIMDNLNYRMIHAPEQMNEYVEKSDAF